MGKRKHVGSGAQKKITVESVNHDVEVEAVREAAAAELPAAAPVVPVAEPRPTLEIPSDTNPAVSAAAAELPAAAAAPPAEQQPITEQVVAQEPAAVASPAAEQPAATVAAAQQQQQTPAEEKTLLQRIYDWLMT
jgi:hypothetical protein